MAARDATRARRAALLLYELAPPIRARILASLSPDERSTIEPLLRELIELRIPLPTRRERGWTTWISRGVMGAGARERAARLDAEIVARCLESCAILTVARILALADWPWKEQVLRTMSESRRAAVLTFLRERLTPLAPAVELKLCELLCETAAQLRSEDSRASSSFRRLIGWSR